MNSFDIRVSKKIQEMGATTMGFWWNVARFGLYGYGIVVLGVAYFITDKHRLADVLIPVLVTVAATLIFQMLFRRPRPKATKTTYDLWVTTFSFPSAHSSTSFAFATSLSIMFLNSSLEVSWVYAVAFILLAISIALSRVIVGVHYFGDVVAGSLLGVLISITLVAL